MGSKPLPGSSSLGQKNGKPAVPTAPRIDYEPLYTALKAGIGANWHLYVESIGLYCRGKLQALFPRMESWSLLVSLREANMNQVS
jgi:hypothetical protein